MNPDDERSERLRQRREAVPYYFIAPSLEGKHGKPDFQRALSTPGQSGYRRWPEDTNRELLIALAERAGDEFFAWKYSTFFCGSFESYQIEFTSPASLLDQSEEFRRNGDIAQSLRFAQRAIWCGAEQFMTDLLCAYQCICFCLLSLGKYDAAREKFNELPVPDDLDDRICYRCLQAWVYAVLGLEQVVREAMTCAVQDHQQLAAMPNDERRTPRDPREAFKEEPAFAPYALREWFISLMKRSD